MTSLTTHTQVHLATWNFMGFLCGVSPLVGPLAQFTCDYRTFPRATNMREIHKRPGCPGSRTSPKLHSVQLQLTSEAYVHGVR